MRSKAGRLGHQRQPQGRDAAEGRLDEPQGEDEHADQRHQVAHRPDRLHRADGGERPLPRCKEERRKRGIGEQEAGVREDERVEVGREDVLPAEAEVDTKVDFVGPQRDVEAVRDRQPQTTRERVPSP